MLYLIISRWIKDLHPGYYALSIIARILFVMAHISFALTMTIYTRNAISGVVFGLVIPNIPKILEMVLGFLKIHISLDFFKISTHMPSVYTASNDLSSFLPCFAVLCAYLTVSVFAGFRLLKYQDIKWFQLEYLHIPGFPGLTDYEQEIYPYQQEMKCEKSSKIGLCWECCLFLIFDNKWYAPFMRDSEKTVIIKGAILCHKKAK